MATKKDINEIKEQLKDISEIKEQLGKITDKLQILNSLEENVKIQLTRINIVNVGKNCACILEGKICTPYFPVLGKTFHNATYIT